MHSDRHRLFVEEIHIKEAQIGLNGLAVPVGPTDHRKEVGIFDFRGLTFKQLTSGPVGKLDVAV